MMTFLHRDRRLTVVEAAINALASQITALEAALAMLPPDAEPGDRMALEQQAADARALQTTLDHERTQLSTDRFEVSDENSEAITADLLWTTTVDLLVAVAADPTIVAVGGVPLLTRETAAAIETLPRGGPAPRPGFLNEITAAGADANVLAELVGFALGRWLRQAENERDFPFREIGVLLPLRLETLFDQQPDGSWLLSLRVTPDEVSIRRDQTQVTPVETECLDEFWTRSKVMEPVAGSAPEEWLLHPDGIVAWEQLCSRVTAPRAAWMVATFRPELQGDAFAVTVPPDRVGALVPDRVAGIPSELVVTVVEKNRQRTEIGVLKPNLSAAKLGIPAGEEAFESWLISWPTAKAVGTGGEFALPPNCTPESIEALYVYGIGDEDPAEHFAAHADAGLMGLLRLGAPTNTVQGTPAAELAQDSESWRFVAVNRLTGERGTGLDNMGEALCGQRSALPHVPGGSNDLRDSRSMVHTLWPALWGHYFRDLWNCGDEAPFLWLWALEALHPEGPFLPLRIGTQPYGVLPVTSLEHWQASGDGDFERIEERIIKGLRQLVPIWADAAEARGTIVGADSKGLLAHLARPGVTARYTYRAFVPAERLAHAYPGVPHADFVAIAERLWSPASDVLQHTPSRPYLATGHAAPLRLPLIGARRLLPPELTLVDMVRNLYQVDADRFASVFYGQTMRGIVPESLLVRLLIHSVFLVKAWFMQSVRGLNEPLLNPLIWNDPAQLTPIENLQTGFPNAEQAGLGGDAIRRLLQLHQERVFRLVSELDQHLVQERDPLDPDSGAVVNQLRLPPERHAELERALRATLDTAGHRIDPWATGVAWRRLRQHIASGRGRHRLGAYGWLDGPFLGKPGPTEAGRLHAPSHAQALTSIILRDKFLSSQDELTAEGRNIWKMDLASTSVRLAIEMADEVRMGFHIFEVVGRRVEGIVGRPDRVRTLRQAKPLRPEKPDSRDTCHGLDALDGLLADALVGVLSNDAMERGRQLERLRELKAALEAYSDLLVGEGVHQVVTGHADMAAEAMDAAAGFSRPPALDFVRTPPSGYRLGTSVIAVFIHHPAVVSGLPVELADASLAAFLGGRFGDAAHWSWEATWQEDEVERNKVVTLAELGLMPLEIVFVPEDFLVEIVRSKAKAPNAEVTSPPAHRLIRQLAGTLGVNPAALSDVSRQPDLADDVLQQFEEGMREELFARYQNVHQACTAFIEEMDAPEVTDPQRIIWLRRALAWGVLGPADKVTRTTLIETLFGELVPTSEILAGLVTSAKDALTGRLAVVPDITNPKTRQLSPNNLARAIGDVVTPGGKLTVTVQWPTQALREASSLHVEAPDATLEDSWLSVTAVVRPSLARLEAAQLEARILQRFQPLSVWSNAPASGDPWQKTIVTENAARRHGDGLTQLDLSRFVAAFGASEAWQGTEVAVALIDQFTEAIPMAERSTYAAFGFNAPAARPPQAILLAVPPRSNQRLAPPETLQILIETRALLRARAARPEDVAGHPVAPSMWFDAASPLRVRLDTGTQYWR